ncbi:MAG: helix-turn-helix transcriptional regulator [Bacteroidia bacterium]
MNSITERIREIRSGRSISQEYMANELGIDTSSYHRLERGTSPLSVTRLSEIARILDVEVVQLIGTQGKPNNDLHDHPYVKHLEDEVRFLRQQVQEQIAKILSIQGHTGSQSPLEARRS